MGLKMKTFATCDWKGKIWKLIVMVMVLAVEMGVTTLATKMAVEIRNMEVAIVEAMKEKKNAWSDEILLKEDTDEH